MPVEHAVAMELSTELIQLVKKIEAIRHHSPRVHSGLEPSSYPVFFALGRGPARVSALADRVHSDVSTVSRQVSNLVSHGLAAKVSDPDDGRAQRVALTEEGEALIQRLQDGRGRWIQQLLVDWDDAKARDFTRHLHEFIGQLSVELDQARAQGADLPEFPPATRKDAS
ncbi:MarR family winged helix-turn-helix transcriptional regulator [Flexivirga alba]|uniref:MarR family winged helix-turn-helix transcriptional regulator n=1 Tax=Flexivirga alba TaxID=702742 RepID=A0ABW2AEN2_9MICO